MHSHTFKPIISALFISTAIYGAWGAVNPFIKLRLKGNPDALNAELCTHESRTSDSLSDNADSTDNEFLPVIIKLDSADATLPDFVYEWHRRGCLVLASVMESDLAELEGWNHVSRVEFNPASAPVLNKAKTFCNIPEITGTSPELNGLTGAGVVTGFCDTGFWPHHINFISPDGTSRVKKLVDYTLSSPYPVITEGESIRSWTTDNPDETHATHVAGILAGGYSADNLEGIATQSTIVATTSPLYEAQLLAGCEEIISYANSTGEPAVINMSISSTIGPHDGTTLFNQYMAEIAEDATVCIAAGNDAHRPCYISHTFSQAAPLVRTYTRDWPSWSTLESRGIIDIWGDDSTPLTVNIVGQHLSSKTIAMRWDGSEALAKGEELIVCSPDLADRFPDHAAEFLPDRYSGYIYLYAETNAENNRYNVFYYCDLTDTTTDDPYKAEYMFGPEITGPEGSTVEIYSSPTLFLASEGDKLAKTGGPERSINDLCTGQGIISVGSFTSRASTPLISGDEQIESKLTIGTPAFYSSYGTLNDGRILPNVTAPGSVIVSSNSSEYLSAHPEMIQQQSLCREINGTSYYWGHEQGTSMAAPFVAGTIALWLQANPALSPVDVREIIRATLAEPALDTANPQWGEGVLDAKAGLEAARKSGIRHINAPDTRNNFTFRTSRGSLFCFSCTTPISTISLIDLSGKTVHTSTPHDFDVQIDCSALADGVYIATALDAKGNSHTAKIAIRSKK